MGVINRYRCRRVKATCLCGVLQVEKLSAELSFIQKGSEEEQETRRKFRELQAELTAAHIQLGDCQDGTQEAQKRVGAVTSYLHHCSHAKAKYTLGYFYSLVLWCCCILSTVKAQALHAHAVNIQNNYQSDILY